MNVGNSSITRSFECIVIPQLCLFDIKLFEDFFITDQVV